MEIIAIGSDAFYKLVGEVAASIQKESAATPRHKWITSNDAMEMVGLKSETPLKKLREEGKIRFSQPHKNIKLYDWDSINDLIEMNANKLS
jgi:hypothetical protein